MALDPSRRTLLACLAATLVLALPWTPVLAEGS